MIRLRLFRLVFTFVVVCGGGQSVAVTAPEALDLVQAAYPPALADSGLRATVTLLLTLDESGRVTLADVVEGADAAFDEAAMDAAFRSRFSPAVDGDTPVVCQITLAYEFEPPAMPAPEAERPVDSLSGASESVFRTRVQGASAAARRLRQSAQAVTVIETKEAKRQTADLGEVVARTEGVGVRRGGGLGSSARFSLNGLTDDQVRFLLDGVPLDFAGYPFGLANVPVNLVERVELYRGVVPIRFGADALGGAVNLVGDRRVHGTHASASYQVGSFGTHRATLSARHLHQPSGLFVRASGFFDHADNDYDIDVEVANLKGKLHPATVSRFHDGYRAMGAHVEAGVVEKPWAKRLLLRGFATSSSKELQHNVVMTVPYGEANSSRMVIGGVLTWEQDFGPDVGLSLVGGYNRSETGFEDLATCIYDWYGQCGLERARPGEIFARTIDQTQWQDAGFARLNLEWRPASGHALRLALAPTVVQRTGEDRTARDANTRDPMRAVQSLGSFVGGVEYLANLLDDHLENVVFVKAYTRHAQSTKTLLEGTSVVDALDTERVGVGNALRVNLGQHLRVKASYEWATRLPRADEAFGDGVLIGSSPMLQPESSHNFNLGLAGETSHEAAGTFRADVNGFVRNASDLIVLMGTENAFSYQNVYGALSSGVEGATGWTSPAQLLSLAANATWQDFRNTSTAGAYKDFQGDRIPNRPYLFANAQARLQKEALFAGQDELSLTWNLRYVHSFFRSWESVGLRSSKQVVPSQSMQSLALTYALPLQSTSLSFTAEVQNLANQKSYDFFGVQRPGRAVFLKTTASL